MLDVCLIIIKKLTKIKIYKIFLSYENTIANKGNIISEEIDAREEYFFIKPIVSRKTSRRHPTRSCTL